MCVFIGGVSRLSTIYLHIVVNKKPIITAVNPKTGLLRLTIRFPILFYRLRSGWLFTSHFLMLTPIGRTEFIRILSFN